LVTEKYQCPKAFKNLQHVLREYTATKFQDGKEIIKHWFFTLLHTTAKILVRRLLHDMDFITEYTLILITGSN
jgi:hypothetical protein